MQYSPSDNGIFRKYFFVTPKEKISHFIDTASSDLESLKDDFFVIGSSALVVSGIELENVADIDLLTSMSDANLLKEKWAAKLLNDYTPEHAELFRSNFGRFNFGSVEVEVMGNLQLYRGNHWVPLVVHNFQNVDVNGFKLKVPTLREQYRIFKFFGRLKDLKKAEMLEKHL